MTARQFLNDLLDALSYHRRQPTPEQAEQIISTYIQRTGRGDHAKCEAELEQEIDNRDRATDWADRLAYAIAPVERIGEHSNGNDPWSNALDIITAERGTPGNVDQATEQLTQAVERWNRAVNADPSANSEAETEYAHDLVKLAAQRLVRAVNAQRPDRQPVGWQPVRW